MVLRCVARPALNHHVPSTDLRRTAFAGQCLTDNPCASQAILTLTTE